MAENMKENLLTIQNLRVEYASGGKTIQAVNGVSLDIPKGASLGLVGETGAGKTTIAKAIMRILPDHATKLVDGEITFDGVSILEASDSQLQKIRGGDISMVFQDPMTALNPIMTVGDQIAEGIALHQHLDKAHAKQEAIRMLETVGISEDRAGEYPHQFSGGMKQRVVIAIALACSPKLLIADEPTTALDVTIEAQILRLMKELRDETGMSVLIITHNMGVVAEICDYVYVMYAGKIMEQAETFELFDHTMHPYTKGLLDSIPRIGQNAERLHTIPGVVPNLLHLSQGCPFSNRCEYATDQCRTEKAQLHPVAPDHQVRCFRCEEEHQ